MLSIDLQAFHALVCGASKGIGRACAVALAQAGASVTAIARTESELIELIGKLPASSHQSHSYVTMDLNDHADLNKKLDTILLDRSFQILVNNTGGPPGGPAHTATVDEFYKAFHQHLISNHILMQKLIPGMKATSYGRIINIISTSVKQPLENLGVSNTIRAAVANWAKTLSNELAAHYITVNNVLPGATQTDRLQSIIDSESKKQKISTEEIAKKMMSSIPAGRFGQASEVANVVAFLASPLASYITGINIPVDGGRTKCL
ncbi:MAG: SDR family oxidoreductase [Saprospiraceae bacterium]|nr:SDR family oxidoreductase [Saprospiraceae bacterium]